MRRNGIDQIKERLSRYNRLKIIFVGYVFIFALVIIYRVLRFYFPQLEQATTTVYDFEWYKHGLLSRFIVLVLIGPFIESLVYQHLLFKIIKNNPLTIARSNVIIVVSGVLFGLSHYYNLSFAIYSFFVGIFIMFIYILRVNKRDSLIVVFLIHAFVNLSLFAEDIFINRGF